MARSSSRKTRSPKKSARPAPARKAAVVRKAAAPGKRAPAPGKAKWVYRFGNGKAEGRADMRDLLGGKGAGLAEMANLGLPVPPGFTITTAVCTHYYDNGKTYPEKLRAEVEAALAEVGRITDKGFGDGSNPLLVSVRSGARASMHGMRDTVLKLGLDDTTAEALAKRSGDRSFAYACDRRFSPVYTDTVERVP